MYLDKLFDCLDLPDIVFDPTSDANKIFSAGKSNEPSWLQVFRVLTPRYVYQDWSNSNDPYALGYLALKSRSTYLCLWIQCVMLTRDAPVCCLNRRQHDGCAQQM